jgi:hypothetical protein
MIPVYGFLEGDVLGLLILADETDTVDAFARKVAAAAAVRIAPGEQLRVRFGERWLDPWATLQSAHVTELDRLDVVRAVQEAGS